MKPELKNILKNPESFKAKPIDYSKDKKKMRALVKAVKNAKEKYRSRPTKESIFIAQIPMTT